MLIYLRKDVNVLIVVRFLLHYGVEMGPGIIYAMPAAYIIK